MRAWPLLVLLCGCGLDESGLLPLADGGPIAADASANARVDATVDAPGDAPGQPDGALPEAEAGPPPPCSTPPGACVASVPAGWSLVAFDPTGANACPSGFGQAATVSDAVAHPGACDCSCSVTSDPSCETGTLQRYISNDATCSTTGMTFSPNGPGCNPLGASGQLSGYSKSTPLGPTGGACAGSPVATRSAVTTQPGYACTPPTACEEDVCLGNAPSPFRSCIVAAGARAQCPAGWGGAPLLVGDDFDLACSACTCDLGGTTCTNASITFYSDGQCTSALVQLPVDGTCQKDGAAGDTTSAWSYQATVHAACSASGPKTATVTLANERTVCCRP